LRSGAGALVRERPEYPKPAMTVAYYSGWGVASELLTCEMRHIVGDMLVLDFEEGKNDESRQFPLDVIPELHETIDRQLEATRKPEIESGRVIPCRFHNNARPIVDLLGCVAQGLRRSRPERAHPA
jgi:hypothetical protein